MHPRLEEVSEKVAGDDTKVDESVFNSEDQEQYVLHRVDDESETEGATRRLRRQRRAHRPPMSKGVREHSHTVGSEEKHPTGIGWK